MPNWFVSAKNDLALGDQAQGERPKQSSVWLGVILVGAGGGGLMNVRADPWLAEGARGTDPGPGFLPEILLWVVVIFGVALVFSVLLKAWRCGGFVPDGEFRFQRLWLPVMLFASLVSYFFAIRSFGFLVPSIVFSLLWVPIIHWRSGRPFLRRHALQFPLESLIIALALYGLFRFVIGVPLP
jgi:hypothetical protein